MTHLHTVQAIYFQVPLHRSGGGGSKYTPSACRSQIIPPAAEEGGAGRDAAAQELTSARSGASALVSYIYSGQVSVLFDWVLGRGSVG